MLTKYWELVCHYVLLKNIKLLIIIFLRLYDIRVSQNVSVIWHYNYFLLLYNLLQQII